VAPQLELRPGPRPGHAWLLRRAPGSMIVWHVDAGADDPLVAVSSDLGGFPATNDLCRDNEFSFDARCPTRDWHRDLLFFSGSPFVVSVPPFSPDSSTWVYLGELGQTASSLFLRQERALEFVSRCDPSLSIEDFAVCEERNRYRTYDDIQVLARQHDPRTPFSNLLVLREPVDDGVRSFEPDLVLLSLGLADDAIAGGLLRAESPLGRLPSPGAPTGVGLDPHATYMLHATVEERPHLLRLPNLSAAMEAIAGLRLDARSELLQLDDDIALGRVEEETWTITKLFPDAPQHSKVTQHRAETPIVAIDHAGPGAFLVHRTDGGPDLLRVRCVEAD
jgi:hypothetical protein